MTVTVSATVAGSWINGAAVATGGALHQVINPATGAVVTELALATPADVDAAVAAARAAFRAGRRHPARAVRGAAPGCRAARRARRRARRRGGRPDRQADPAGPRVRRAGHHRQHRLLRRRRPPPRGQGHARSTPATTPPASGASRSASSASIAPWNYPLQMAAWKVLPAIAAGNTIVLKPAELTPLTTLLFAEAATEAGLPAGVVNVVTGSGRGRRRGAGRPSRRRRWCRSPARPPSAAR